MAPPPGDVPVTAAVSANGADPFGAFAAFTAPVAGLAWVEHGETVLDRHAPAVSAEAGGAVEQVLRGLRADRDHLVRAAGGAGDAAWAGPTSTWSTPPLADGWPVCTATFHVDPEEFSPDEVVCANGSTPDGLLRHMCWDRRGEPVLAVGTDGNDALLSMRALPTGGWVSTASTRSMLARFDAAGRETTRLPASWLEGRTRFRHDQVDSHEAYVLPAGPWEGAVAFLTTTTEFLDDGTYVLGNGVVVVDLDAEAVLWDWSFHGASGDGVAADPLVPYTRAGQGSPPEDWTHANYLAWDADPDGRGFFLVGLRAQDWVVKLYPDTDAIAWRLGPGGDFLLVDDLDAVEPAPLPDEAWPHRAHGGVLVAGAPPRLRLLLFDNGEPDDVGDVSSRVLALDVDEARGRAAVYAAVGDAAHGDPSPLASATCGSAELLPGGRAVLAVEGEAHRFVEWSWPDGTPRWEMVCPSTEWCTYRAHHAASLYALDGAP